jgi:hypothetical protein
VGTCERFLSKGKQEDGKQDGSFAAEENSLSARCAG